jgi:hypothetical protein
MMGETAQPVEGFSQLYARMLGELAEQVGECPASYGEASQNIREEIVRCLWFGSHFSAEQLRTDRGARLEVLSPGWWNVEAGPDFMRAEILMEGRGRLVGDVEVHTMPSAWYAHGHHQQPEYNDVCLHVVMWSDGQERPIRREDGEVVPQLTLSEFLDAEIGELVEIVDMEGQPGDSPGESPVPRRYCGEAIASGEIQPAWLGRLLDCAGDHRILTRADRMGRAMRENSREEILYARVADALGYKNNRMGFRQLVETLPIALLKELVPVDAPIPEKQRVLQAAYYGVGGFLHDPPPDADDETIGYMEWLKCIWSQFPERLRERQMSAGHWKFGGTRPVNFPTRRMAALANLYARHLPGGLFGALVKSVRSARVEGRRRLDTVIRGNLTGLFTSLEDPYWNHRYKMGGSRLSSARALVGEQRACAILVDVLIPILCAHARSQDDAELNGRISRVWSRLPRRNPNTVVRRMREVMFGGDGLAREVINSARRQQGLHQLHNDFCHSAEGCRSCIIYLAHRDGRDLTEV